MPISKVAGEVVKTPAQNFDEFQQTGVVQASQFAIADHDRLKQVAFNPAPSATNSTVTFATGAGTTGAIVLTLPSTSGTLSTASGTGSTFKTWQPITGTSPTAVSPTDTMTLTSSDGSILIAGNSTTDVLDFKVGSVPLGDIPLASAHLLVGNGSNVAADVALTGDVSILNTGASTVATVGGSTAANVHAAELLANAATNSNTASAIVKRDGSGNFVAGTITAALTGTASGNTTYTPNNNGVVTSGSANAMTVVAPGSQEQMLVTSSTGAPVWRTLMHPSTVVTIYDEFDSAATGSAHTWSATAVSGGGNTISSGLATNPGITNLTTGTSNAAGSESIRMALNGYILGGGTLSTSIVTRIPSLSTAAQTFACLLGMSGTASSKAPANGVYYVYLPAGTFTFTGTTTNGSTSVTGLTSPSGVIDSTSIQATQAITGTGIAASTTVSSVNAGAGTLVLSQNATASGTVTLTFTIGDFWCCACAKAAATSLQVTSQAVVANTFYKLEWLANAAGTSVAFTLNNSLIATIATNVPIVIIGPNLYIEKSNGTGTAGTLDVDYWWHQLVFTTAR